MPGHIEEHHGIGVLVADADGPAVTTVQDALDLIGEAFQGAQVVALPAARLTGDFFTLGTGLAGEIMQKFVNYRIRLVVLGDLGRWLERSSALRALVAESNRGEHVWFLADLGELAERLKDG
ncbi:DUF4180 domain-containing protein [Catellatospora sp. NPDC049609]|uniref:DUF4180 domain-containing protein n=1 Tax=Catellatospora sp. NPDC049609 TaxID=3155505 RepID=UPI003425154D